MDYRRSTATLAFRIASCVVQDAALLVDESVAALRAFGVEAFLDYDLEVFAVLLLRFDVVVDRAVLLGGLNGR